MILRFIMGIILVGSLVGCVTTQKPTMSSQLQIRVAHIESQLDDQGRDIAQLRSSVEELSLHSRTTIAPSLNTRKIVKSSPAKVPKTAGNQKILRVLVTPHEVQTGLKNDGYYTGAIDGKLGAGSKRAIKEFQTDHDLESDGIIGKKTWAELKNYLE